MRAILHVLAALAAVPSLALADVSTINCSGLQSSAPGDVTSFTCTGDFSLSGGILAASSKIVLSSFGALSLQDIALSAPRIDLIAGTAISLGSGVSITTGVLSIGGNPGGQSPLLTTVPDAEISIGGGPLHSIGPGDISMISAGNLSPLPGGIGSISLQAPEPGIFMLLLPGLLCLGLFLRTRARG